MRYVLRFLPSLKHYLQAINVAARYSDITLASQLIKLISNR